MEIKKFDLIPVFAAPPLHPFRFVDPTGCKASGRVLQR
jgi:hypothetical protein